MARTWLIWSGALGALGVALGAFGAHVLKQVLPLQMMTVFETGVRYHLVHTVALLGVALLMEQYPQQARRLRTVAALFVAGVLLFSGSLYGLALSDLRLLAWLTPLGGLAWIVGWVLLAVTFRRSARG